VSIEYFMTNESQGNVRVSFRNVLKAAPCNFLVTICNQNNSS
jgi:hypothetical protein